jgi:16S rRNA (cytidine1402-2'-O)-methyltransferase
VGAIVYLVPSLLHEEGLASIPPYIVDTIRRCQVLFVEDERTARRFLKKLDKQILIDKYEWYPMTTTPERPAPGQVFKEKLKEEKIIGIISDAGCPGIADPGQELVSIAQERNIDVRPLVGPNSVLLALMASGMNGQQFRFNGYLPIKDQERNKMIKELETESARKNCTQIFIETPYRNNQLIDALLSNCQSATKICIAVDLTSDKESIRTKTVIEWRKNIPDIHKRPAIFLLYASS